MKAVQTKNLLKAVATIVSVKNLRGASFVGVMNYTNEQGEVSNQTFNVGISYSNVLKNDLTALLAFNPADLKTDIAADIVNAAYTEMVESLSKRLSDEQTKDLLRAQGDKTIAQSDAQNEAYIHIAKGLKLKDNCLYVYGLRIRKQVLVKGEYKTVNSRPKTIAKNLIAKQLDLRGDKFRMFKLGDKETLKINGLTI